MRKIILIITILAFTTSCNFKKKPEFQRIDNVGVIEANLSEVSLKADAVFKNLNHLGGKLKTDNIDVFIDNQLIAKVSSEEFKVPARDEFTIPLMVKFDASKLINGNKNGLLGSLVKQLLNQKVNVQFKGELSYTIAGFKAVYPIDHIEEIEIK